jgi:peptidoglycan/LPS O-acetylase OafA/YrhL
MTTVTDAARGTLAGRFDPRNNSLNALRLVLASSVIVSHSWVLSGASHSAPGWGNQLVGDIAVDGFFAISGFLIFGSRMASRSLRDFFWRRFLRIWPAYAVVLLFVAAAVAPFTALVLGNGSYQPLSGVTYVLKNLALVVFQPGIESTPVGIPETGNWNAPLWTLSYEFACYVLIALVVTVIPKRVVGPVLFAGLAGAIAVNVVSHAGLLDLPDPLVVLARLGAFFLCGSLLFAYRDRMPLGPVAGIVALAVTVALLALQVFDIVGGPAFAVLLLWLGVVLPLRKVGKVNDISYGMYVYGYPLQLVLAVIAGTALHPVVFAAISVLITIPFAAASWFAIEKPAMRLKRLTAAPRPAKAESFPDAPAI